MNQTSDNTVSSVIATGLCAQSRSRRSKRRRTKFLDTVMLAMSGATQICGTDVDHVA